MFKVLQTPLSLLSFDMGGHPHTVDLRVTERFHRRDFGHIDVKVTFDDPTIYSRPWTVPITLNLMADRELIEYVCNENEQSCSALRRIGERSRAVARSSAPRAKDIGRVRWRLRSDWCHGQHICVHSGTWGRPTHSAVPGLFLAKFPLSAQSETTFTLFSPYLAEIDLVFVRDTTGKANELTARFSQGQHHATRRREQR